METFSTLLGLCELWGESTGHQWIPLTKASDADLWFCFLWSAPEETFLANNQDADGLRRHRARYDVTVMKSASDKDDIAVIVGGVKLIHVLTFSRSWQSVPDDALKLSTVTIQGSD